MGEGDYLNIFKGKIKCNNCGKNYKFKMIRKRAGYVCSGFSNYGKEFCSSYFLLEEDIIDTVNRHAFLHNKDINTEEVAQYVKNIEVEGEGYKINYTDGEQSLVNVKNEHGMICVRY